MSDDTDHLVAQLTEIIAKLQLKLGSEKARKLVRRIVDDLGAPERKPKE
jgi:hypothetical protein